MIIRILLAISTLVMGMAVCSWAQTPKEPMIVDLYMGEQVTFETMMDDLAESKIIYLGEIHTIPRHHQLQTEILLDLASRNVKAALGMEMFSIDQQEALDRWQEGDSDIGELIRLLGKGSWTNLRDYELTLIVARKLGMPIVALNAPDKLVKMVAAHGTEQLSDSEKAMIPPDFKNVNPAYDKLLRLRLKVHKAFQHSVLDNIVAAQALRDYIMAKSINDFMDSEAGSDRVMLVVAGTGHLNYGFGIPERVEKLNNYRQRIVVASESGELVLSEEEKNQSIPIHISHEDLKFIKRPIGDYLQLIPVTQKSVIVRSNQ